jgi:protein TonB
MEANQILQSGFLEILFEGRNKSYGAYDLRKRITRESALVFSLS